MSKSNAETCTDSIDLLYQNAEAGSALWLAVEHAVNGLDTVAGHLTEVSIHDDFEAFEGYVSLLHVIVGHLRAAGDTFERSHLNDYEFPASIKRQRPKIEEGDHEE